MRRTRRPTSPGARVSSGGAAAVEGQLNSTIKQRRSNKGGKGGVGRVGFIALSCSQSNREREGLRIGGGGGGKKHEE
eukprot:8402659-Pyramimonas_sp.AAC.1